MANAVLIPNEQSVFRGMRNSNWVKNRIIQWKAYMLRPATPDYPAEEFLSLGLTMQAAIEELREKHGAAELSVLAIQTLPHLLTVRATPGEDTKAEIHGLPLYSTEPAQRDLAITMATDLAGISHFVDEHQGQPQ